MQLVLEKRAERSTRIAIVSPLLAVALTLVTMSILFAILGKTTDWLIQLAATPLLRWQDSFSAHGGKA